MVDISDVRSWFAVIAVGIIEIPTVLQLITTTDNDLDKILIFAGSIGLLLLLIYIVNASNNNNSYLLKVRKVISNISTLNESINTITEEIVAESDPSIKNAYDKIRKILTEQRDKLHDQLTS